MFMLCLKNAFYRNCIEIGEEINGAFKLIGLACLVCFLGCDPAPVYGQSVIRTLAWELDTARPATVEWPLVRGETVDLECRYLAGASAMDVRGAAVVLHCRTNGMLADVSFQVTGRVGRVSSTNLASVGWVTVRVRPDLDLPHDVKSCTFALETTLNSARNLVATGLLRLVGDPTGATPAAMALNLYDAFGSSQSMGARLDAELYEIMTVTVPSQINAATTGLVNAEGVATLIAAIPPASTDSLRLVTPDKTEWRDATGGVWRVAYVAETNIICTLSPVFGVMIGPDSYDRPEQSVFVGPPNTQIDAGNSWYINFDQNCEGLYNVFNYWYPAYWAAAGYELPLVAQPGGYPWYGTATFDYQITYTAVTSMVDTVALVSQLPAPGVSAEVVTQIVMAATAELSSSFTNSLLYSTSLTNFYWRYSDALQSYQVTGVPK